MTSVKNQSNFKVNPTEKTGKKGKEEKKRRENNRNNYTQIL